MAESKNMSKTVKEEIREKIDSFKEMFEGKVVVGSHRRRDVKMGFK